MSVTLDLGLLLIRRLHHVNGVIELFKILFFFCRKTNDQSFTMCRSFYEKLGV